MHLGLIGFGNIARTLLTVLAAERAALSAVTVLTLPEFASQTRADLAGLTRAPGHVVTDAAGLIALAPDLVVECAGHQAVAEHATTVLRAGIETVIVSIGALADEALYAAVVAAALAGNSRFTLPAGAIGGIDILSALRPSGILSVSYTGRKPPGAWAGTPAEGLLDLKALTAEAVFFEGTARQAATLYPKNANVAATLALAGLGWEETRVRLIADPGVTRNVHEYSVTSGAADYTMRIEGKPSADNPKTSVTTVYSVAREVLNRLREVAI